MDEVERLREECELHVEHILRLDKEVADLENTGDALKHMMARRQTIIDDIVTILVAEGFAVLPED